MIKSKVWSCNKSYLLSNKYFNKFSDYQTHIILVKMSSNIYNTMAFIAEKARFTMELSQKLLQDQKVFYYQLTKPRLQVMNILLLIIRRYQTMQFLKIYSQNIINFTVNSVQIEENLTAVKKINSTKKFMQEDIKKVNANIKKYYQQIFKGKLNRLLEEQFEQSESYLISLIRNYQNRVDVFLYYDQLRNFLIKHGIPSDLENARQNSQVNCYRLILEIDLACQKQKKYPTSSHHLMKEFIQQVKDIRIMTLTEAKQKVNVLKGMIIKTKKDQQKSLLQTSEKLFHDQTFFMKYIGENKEVAYNTKDKLSSGAYSDIYSGMFVKQKVNVAVKLLKNKIKKKNNRDFTKYQKELELIKKINHPNIMKLYFSYIDQQGNTFVVLEKCLKSLYDQMSTNTKIMESKVYKYSYQIIAAISYLHNSCNILHRDLKPQNIMINNQAIKIADFSLARNNLLENQLQFTTVIGSTAYMAPQLITAQQNHKQTVRYGSKCDVWSIGCIIYEMLAGQPLFSNQNSKQQKLDYQTKIKNTLKNMDKFWTDLLVQQMLVFQQQYRASSKRTMEIFQKKVDNFIIDQQQVRKLKQLSKMKRQEKSIFEKIEEMLYFRYKKIKLTDIIIAKIQKTQTVQLYLSEYMRLILQFILLNWYKLELKSFCQMLAAQSIDFQGKSYSVDKNSSLTNIRYSLLNQAKKELQKQEQILKQFYTDLSNPKFLQEKDNLKKNNPKIISSITYYQSIENSRVCNEILNQFLRAYGIPKVNNQLEPQMRQDIWMMTAQLFLLDAKQIRFPVKPPYQPQIFQREFADIKTMKLTKKKLLVSEILRNFKTIYPQIEQRAKSSLIKINSIQKSKEKIIKPPSKQNTQTVYEKAYMLLDFKYCKIKMIYKYIYEYQQNQDYPIDQYHFSIIAFLFIFWYKMQITELLKENSKQLLIFQNYQLKMQQTQASQQFLNKRNTILNEILEKIKKTNNYLQQYVNFVSKSKYNEQKKAVTMRYPDLIVLLQQYKKIEIPSVKASKLFIQCLKDYGTNISKIQKLQPQKALKVYHFLVAICVLNQKDKQFSNNPPYSKNIIYQKFEVIGKMKKEEAINQLSNIYKLFKY